MPANVTTSDEGYIRMMMVDIIRAFIKFQFTTLFESSSKTE